MNEHGGMVTVHGFLVMLLIAAGVASGATSLWLAANRTIEFSCRPEGSAAYPSHKAASGIVRTSARIIS